MPEPAHTPGRRDWIVLAVLLALITAFSWWAFPKAPAYTVDANTYLAGAMSLANGDGYRFATQVGTPPITHYPPLHSFYLSLPWRLNPAFPANVPLLNVAMLFLGLVTCASLFMILRWQGVPLGATTLCIALLGLSPNWLTLQALLFSDVLFTAIITTLVWLWLNPRFADKDWRFAATGIGLAAAYLTRTAALGIIAGATLALLWQVRRKGLKSTATLLLPIGLAMLWWQGQVAFGFNYTSDFQQRFSGAGGWTGYFKATFANGWEVVNGNWLADTLLPVVVRLPQSQFAQGAWQPVVMVASLLVTLGFAALIAIGLWLDRSLFGRISAIVAGVYLLELILWPFPLGYRALFVLLPIALHWACQGCLAVESRFFKPGSLRIGLAVFLALNVCANLMLAVKERDQREAFGRLAELREVSDWLLKSFPEREGAIIAVSVEVPLTHLHVFSGRRFAGGDAGFSARRLQESGAVALVAAGERMAADYGVEEGRMLFRSSGGAYAVFPVRRAE